MDEATREKELVTIEPTGVPALHVSTPDVEATTQSASPSHPSTSREQEFPSDEEELEASAGFDFSLIGPFAKSVKEAINWEEPGEVQQKQRKYFPNLKKVPQAFPFIEELDELIKEEWQNPEKKISLSNRLTKLYPLKEPKVCPLVSPPVVDASLMRLARHVTLPIEDGDVQGCTGQKGGYGP